MSHNSEHKTGAPEGGRPLWNLPNIALAVASCSLVLSGFVAYQHQVLIRKLDTSIATGILMADEIRVGNHTDAQMTLTGEEVRIARHYHTPMSMSLSADQIRMKRGDGKFISLGIATGRAMLFMVDEDCTNHVSLVTNGEIGPHFSMKNALLGREVEFILYDRDAVILRRNKDGTTDRIVPNKPSGNDG